MDLESLFSGGSAPAEGRLLECKREWYDFGNAVGKANFAKDVLAIANSLSEGETGLIVVGVDDSRALVGVDESESPKPEQVSQILSNYTNPCPSVETKLGVVACDRRLDVVEIAWSCYHPHYSVRDLAGVLSKSHVYSRRGPMNVVLTPSEFESLIRAKGARLGASTGDEFIRVGFVEMPHDGRGELSVRIENPTDEPVGSISATIDVATVHPKRQTFRARSLQNLELGPGESREFSFRPASLLVFDGMDRFEWESKVWSNWLNVSVHVHYRGRSGVLGRASCETRVG